MVDQLLSSSTLKMKLLMSCPRYFPIVHLTFDDFGVFWEAVKQAYKARDASLLVLGVYEPIQGGGGTSKNIV
jgi:hypothetical protein